MSAVVKDIKVNITLSGSKLTEALGPDGKDVKAAMKTIDEEFKFIRQELVRMLDGQIGGNKVVLKSK